MLQSRKLARLGCQQEGKTAVFTASGGETSLDPQQCLLIVCVCTCTLAEAGVHTRLLTCMNVQKVRTLCEQVVFHLFGDRVPHWDLELAKKGRLADYEPQGPD